MLVFLEKIALIILPPKQEEKNEIVPNPNPKKSKKRQTPFWVCLNVNNEKDIFSRFN